MKINRASHIPWAIFVLVATAAAALLYAANVYPQRLPPGLRFFGETPPDHAIIGGTPLGLFFGAIALGIFVFAALLGARKKLPFLRLGTVPAWMRAHIWLTLLTIPLILLHSGFHFGGPMTTLLMVVYGIVMVSGIYGLVLQNKIPTYMKEHLPAEIVYEQIPEIRAQLCAAAEGLRKTYRHELTTEADEPSMSSPAATVLSSAGMPDVSTFAVFKTASAAERPPGGKTVRGTPLDPAAMTAFDSDEGGGEDVIADAPSESLLLDFIERQLLPYLRAGRGDKLPLGHAQRAEDTFRQLKLRVAGPYRARVEEMQGWCEERRLLDTQTRLQHWLHGWLLVHVPLSFLLLLLTAWHAFLTIFHY